MNCHFVYFDHFRDLSVTCKKAKRVCFIKMQQLKLKFTYVQINMKHPIELSMKFIMLKNFKMPTDVDFLTFMNMKNTTSDSLKAKQVFIYKHLSSYEQVEFRA